MQDQRDPTTVLAHRAQHGDMDALTELTERFTPQLLALAKHRVKGLKNQVDAEDLVQETWCIALQKLPDLQPRGGRLTPTVVCFLATTLIHRYNNLKRRVITGRSIVADLADLDEPGAVPEEGVKTISNVVRREHQTLLHDALQSLDPIEREIVILRGIEQVPVKDVAVIVRLSKKNVSNRYLRALERLRERLPKSLLDDLRS